jgi:hypothetical protein
LKWKYISNDKKLLDTLFTNNYFDEIYTLMSISKTRWNFTSEQFKIVIYNGSQLDLILYFLRDPSCVKLLHDGDIQQHIVKKYLK